MFKSKSKKQQKQLRFGDGGRGRLKSKAPSKTCKKHPKHEQSPGVCAICLREKLTHLPTSSSKITRGNNVVSSSTTSSYLSSSPSQDYSSNVSSCSSPNNYRRSYSSMATFSKSPKKSYHEHNNKDGGRNLNSSKNVFSKSRSLAFLMQKPRLDETVDKNHGKKKQGWWSKLLHSRTRNREDHHNTTKSRTTLQ